MTPAWKDLQAIARSNYGALMNPPQMSPVKNVAQRHFECAFQRAAPAFVFASLDEDCEIC